MKNKKLLILRYFILVMLILSIIFSMNKEIDAYGTILILLIIINNQIRIFVFQDRENIIFLSLILECILSFISYENYGGWIIFYFINGIIDGSLLLEGKWTIISNIFYLFNLGLMGRNLDRGVSIYNISMLGIISILSISGFITAFVRKKFVKPILYVLMLMQLVLGVTSPSIENMNFEPLKIIAKKYSPDILISSTFKNYLIYNNLESIKLYLILMVGVSMGLYILSLLKLKRGGNYENSEA